MTSVPWNMLSTCLNFIGHLSINKHPHLRLRRNEENLHLGKWKKSETKLILSPWLILGSVTFSIQQLVFFASLFYLWGAKSYLQLLKADIEYFQIPDSHSWDLQFYLFKLEMTWGFMAESSIDTPLTRLLWSVALTQLGPLSGGWECWSPWRWRRRGLLYWTWLRDSFKSGKTVPVSLAAPPPSYESSPFTSFGNV